MTEEPGIISKARKYRNQSLLLFVLALLANPMTLMLLSAIFPPTNAVFEMVSPEAMLFTCTAACVLFALLSLLQGFRYAFHGRKTPGVILVRCLPMVVANSLVLLLLGAFILMMLWQPISSPRCASCQNNLKQHGLVCKMFGNDNGGVFPPLSPEPGRLAYAASELCGQIGTHPEYLSDAHILLCPDDADYAEQREEFDADHLMDDWSYFYLGYAVASDAEMRTFSEAYGDRMARGEPLCDDIPVAAGTGSFGADTLSRLGENLFPPQEPGHEENPLFGTIPVIIERRGNHPDNAVNVLWMDGHVTLLKPGTWPNTDETMAALAAMDALSPPAK